MSSGGRTSRWPSQETQGAVRRAPLHKGKKPESLSGKSVLSGVP